jgi:hypothetical protein
MYSRCRGQEELAHKKNKPRPAAEEQEKERIIKKE